MLPWSTIARIARIGLLQVVRGQEERRAVVAESCCRTQMLRVTGVEPSVVVENTISGRGDAPARSSAAASRRRTTARGPPPVFEAEQSSASSSAPCSLPRDPYRGCRSGGSPRVSRVERRLLEDDADLPPDPSGPARRRSPRRAPSPRGLQQRRQHPIVVVLPPVRPRNPKNSPGRTSRSIASTARTAVVAPSPVTGSRLRCTSGDT